MTKKSKNICSVAAALVLIILLMCSYQFTNSSSMLRTVLQLGAIYALAASSMNLLNGVTGLFSLGQAGFMAVGAYTFAIFTIPVEKKAGVYYLYGVADGLADIALPAVVGLLLAGIMAAIFAAIIGAPVLRLKSDYFAIATLGFAEIVRILVASSPLNRITNGSLGLKAIPGFTDLFGIIPAYYVPFIIVTICIALMVLLIRSSYGRAFKAIREDEIAAEAMGINLAKHKRMAFIISSFFAGISGALLAQFLGAVQSTTFPLAMTYNILLIVVIGGMGSITGSIIAAVLVPIINYLLQNYVPADLAALRYLIYALVLIFIVVFSNAPALQPLRDKLRIPVLLKKLRKHQKHDPAKFKDDEASWDRVPTKIPMDAILTTDINPNRTNTGNPDIGDSKGGKSK